MHRFPLGRRRVAARVLALGATALAVSAAPAGAITVGPVDTDAIVRANALQGWTFGTQATSSHALAEGPASPPAGTGSLHLATGAGDLPQGGKEVAYQPAFAGKTIADVHELAYSTFVEQRLDGTGVAPSMAFEVTGANTGTTSGYTTLTYEPVYDTSQSTATGAWQSWNPTGASARWWCSREVTLGDGSKCNNSTYLPWSTIQANLGSATISPGGLEISTGQNSAGAPWQNFEGAVDDVFAAIGITATSYDFEPAVPAATPVRRTDLEGWTFAAQATSTLGFLPGPATVPAGVGSLHLTTGPGRNGQGGKSVAYQTAFAGRHIADVQALLYSAFVGRRADGTVVAPSMAFEVTGANTGTPSGYTTLTYEPAYDTARPTGTGDWQTWNPTGATARWWCSREVTLDDGSKCNSSTYLPWSTIRDNLAGATLSPGGLEITAGQNGLGLPWENFEGAVDNVLAAIGGTTHRYDFETELPVVLPPAPGPASPSAPSQNTAPAVTPVPPVIVAGSHNDSALPTPAEIAAAREAADELAGVPTVFVGRVGSALVFRPSEGSRGFLDLSSLFTGTDAPSAFSVAVLDCTSACIVRERQTLVLDGASASARHSSKRSTRLLSRQLRLKAGHSRRLSAKLNRRQLAAVRHAGGARVITTLKVVDRTGAHTTRTTTRIKVRKSARRHRRG